MQKNFAKLLLNTIKKVTKSKSPKLHEPYFDKLEIKEIKKCIGSNFVSTAGPQVKKFEKKISQLTKSKFVIATNSGTSALHLALKAINIKFDSEVLIPSLNFVASANAIKYCNAEPHFIDSDQKNLSVDPNKLSEYLKENTKISNGKCINKKTKKVIKALILVHIFGLSGDVLEIKKICKLNKIELIEDAAEAVGSYYKNKHLGTFGRIGVLSFNGNKTITTGAGGALITNDKKLAKKIYKLSQISKVSHKWRLEYDDVGYNYRMASLNAALGISQLKKLNILLKNKKKLYSKYLKAFKNFKEFKLLNQSKNCKSNFWLITILLNENSLSKRDKIIEFLNNNGVQVRPCWKPLHRLKHFSKCPKMDLSNAEILEKKIINIPSSSVYGKN